MSRCTKFAETAVWDASMENFEFMRTWRNLRCKYLRVSQRTVGSCREERYFCFLHRAPLHEEAAWKDARGKGKNDNTILD
jgi:hypothetical protein